ncbi:hypothetical protein ASG29_08510 [Sphingomonas sp. Leaf412]|uniref:XrtA/PEP-CTERM system histidine kinase PrsK n=1 Tax=Sphingomonas sp. Leaf412 TaxID=1736370 RepID=UPI0006F39F3F|nr:XrtA/PEP-CTERM system histidine kinase PrsK [Sphingomonas sp. Leaf412]KQT31912.1 hypothetical protein ASG29_08510 [Sphingomonas sp. Leaf412]
MVQGAIIWVHAIVAMLFAGIALMQWRTPGRLVPRAPLLPALALSALWALGVAGIGGGDVAVWLAGAARDGAWLALLFVLTRARRWRGAAFAATAGCVLLAAALRLTVEVAGGSAAQPVLMEGTAVVHMLAAAGALVLAGRARVDAAPRGGAGVLIGALVMLWGVDVVVDAVAWAGGGRPPVLTLVRGLAAAVVAATVAVAVHRDGEWTLRPSHAIVVRSVATALGIAMLAGIVAASGVVAALGGANARVVQTAFVVAAGASMVTLVSTPWLRAWVRVTVSKHLFSHRYDYRVAWMRFTATLAAPDDAPRPLAERVVKAMADLTDSAAGLLLRVDHDTLVAGAAWRWEAAAGEDGGTALAEHLAATRRIVALDEVRRGAAPAAEIAATPDWAVARAEAWAIVPLLHGERLVGAIVLSRPTIDRAPDWEDFDLLGVAARQVASYLAEDDAHAALAEARRFEEFNRRFAFLLHDLKNLVSQMALVARNAERHAENPAFRADMIATLRDTSQRMATLLAKLSHRPADPAEPSCAVALRALAERVADARRAQHPLRVEGGEVLALAAPAMLEAVLGHLLQNAIEASEPGVAVVLAVGQEGDAAIIDVVDRGAGMSPAFVRESLFTPFASTKPTGFGLGACEARALVGAMGGTLSVDSREGAGTRFRIVLPRAARMEEAA